MGTIFLAFRKAEYASDMKPSSFTSEEKKKHVHWACVRIFIATILVVARAREPNCPLIRMKMGIMI